MKHLISKLFEQGKKMGFTDMEILTNENESFEVKIYEQQIDSYKVTDSKGMGFRGVYENKMGYSYTEKLADDSIEILLREAMQNAMINDNPDQDKIFEGSKEYVKTNNYFPELDKVTVEEKIQFAKDMESIAKSMDSRIKSCPYCFFGSSSGKSALVNTKGLELTDKGNSIYCYMEALAQDGEDLSDGFSFCFENNFSDFKPENLAKEAVEKAISYMGAKPIASGTYKTIILNTVSSDILSAVNSCFSARAVQKGMSFLKGKLGKKVASQAVTIVDDPFLPGQSGTSSFDGEGVATRYKEVIKEGVLKTYLHNMKTAKIDNTESTGNASRSYKSNIGVAPTNLYFTKGDKSFNELLNQMGDGIVITEVSALHSGFNDISGDFSLPAKGYTVKNGTKEKYFRQVTVSGNYFELLNDVLMTGDDLTFGTNGNIGSPSLYISKISVAGE
ncbi:MAG TPA: TldD/PmbA family protein [Clostridia bacterium]|nr:MAG: peptidase PmbA [Firmicutes bacterium ADurb.Bin146]HOD92959.1 TldD/PmbA family protein [Clostridia bacterium]HQM39269.1 TldD/PmbA family protein [Clostridia bacterium]